jgi:hypothetical protein
MFELRKKMKQRINFITYSDTSEFSISKKHLTSLAQESKFFDSVISYSRQDLDEEFVKKYLNILKHERGGGYWLWKINIINKTLKEMKDNDILLYMDAGSSLNYFAKKRFYEYIQMINEVREIGNLRFESEKHHIEKIWTSKEVFSELKIPIESDIGNSTQLEGGHLLFKKNEHTLELLDTFIKVVDADNNLITDHYNNSIQIDGFEECRHDQSILSLLSKKHGCVRIENETDFRSREDMQFDYPILAVRKKGHGIKDRVKYSIFKNYYKKRPAYFNI